MLLKMPIDSAIIACNKSGGLTQMVEYHLDMVEVAGSSPVSPTKQVGRYLQFLYIDFEAKK